MIKAIRRIREMILKSIIIRIIRIIRIIIIIIIIIILTTIR